MYYVRIEEIDDSHRLRTSMEWFTQLRMAKNRARKLEEESSLVWTIVGYDDRSYPGEEREPNGRD